MIITREVIEAAREALSTGPTNDGLDTIDMALRDAGVENYADLGNVLAETMADSGADMEGLVWAFMGLSMGIVATHNLSTKTEE